jgi:hypothetical protein
LHDLLNANGNTVNFRHGPYNNLTAIFLEGSINITDNVFYNAVAECFFHTLKVELIHGKVYGTWQEVKTAIFDYIEIFYNRQRRHSYLGYLSPEEYEKKSVAYFCMARSIKRSKRLWELWKES